MLVATVMISEAMVNRNSEDEPAFKFFKGNYSKLRGLMSRLFVAIKTITGSSVAHD
jgi:hypothetical protein